MNFKRSHGIVYNKIKSAQNEKIAIYKPVPAPIDKIQNKYRWRMIVKCKVNAKILDLVKYGTTDAQITKMKNTSIIIDINPNNLM